MNKLLITAAASGSGKTAVTCALLAALQKRGKKVCAFKCGPDYIDPMFHRSILGVESHNLDLFLSTEEAVRNLFETYSAGKDAAIVEGVMGYYDGLGGVTDRASAYHVADTLHLPVLLVLRPKGTSLTLAAQVKGLCGFRAPHHIAGILMNDCSPMLYQSLAPMLEKETGLSVFGYLPHMEEAAFESRHLGLYTAAEIDNLTARIEKLAEQMEKSVDLEKLLYVCQFEENILENRAEEKRESYVRLAVAKDEAFCFLYEETLDILQKAGVEIVYFSPLHDNCLPKNIDGLYLPGGYPELYAKGLSENEVMRNTIRTAVENGLPTVAECGGFLYLCQTLQDAEGVFQRMAGVLSVNGVKTEKLVRFGYAELRANADSMLFRKVETVPIHEFHYWDTTERGEAFTVEKPISGRSWQCGFANETLYAGFPHLYFAGNEKLVQRFVAAMEKRRKEKNYESL